MAGAAKQSKQKQRKKQKSQRRVVQPGPPKFAPRGVDSGAKAYARLLVDPIGAPLCHPVASGGESGYLLRADSTITFALGAGKTGGYVFVAPGNLGSGNVELLYQD